MTDITRLLASLKRRSAHAKKFGDSITFVKLKDIDALVEALEKAQGMEGYWKTQCRGITNHCEQLQAQIVELESRTVTVKLPQAVSAGGQGYQEQVERILTAAGIKVEAE
ncbi:hypothetical protein RE066_001479 [Klebsiella aerogenes]|nr:hypothetical protein [Klebsiella aerogenes]